MTNKLYIFLLLLWSAQVFPQASASAKIEAQARVVEPIRINKAMDLNFGNVFGGYVSGSVTLSPDGVRTASGVQIAETVAGNVSAAEAIVVHGNNSYSVSLPNSITLVNEKNPNEVLEVGDFTLSQVGNPATGNDILKIGATLHMDSNQEPGIYSYSDGFNVTVSYN